MSKLKRINVILALIALTNPLLLLPPSTTGLTSPSAILSSTGVIRDVTNSWHMYGGNTPDNVFFPGAANYHSNYASMFKDKLGLNTLRVYIGSEGNVWKTNMKTYADNDAWADGLKNLINTVKAMGLKFYFFSLSDPWGGELGILEPNWLNLNHGVTPDSVATAKSLIDKLAGANKYGYNFLTDPTIPMWNVANEAYIGTVDSSGVFHANSNLDWIIQVSDYIRSKGGKVAVPSPIVDSSYPGDSSSWNTHFRWTVPALEGHVDYLDNHVYAIWDLATHYSLGNQQYDWAGWRSHVQSFYFQDMIDYRGSYDIDRILVDEFGIWRGSGTDSGLAGYYFSDENRRDYYISWFQAAKAVGLLNIAFHFDIEITGTGTPVYAVFDTSGQPYPYVVDVIKQNSGSL